MIKAVKIRVFPTKEQEEFMWKSVGVARFTYNWAVTEWKKLRQEGTTLSARKLRTRFNHEMKAKEEFSWLTEPSGQVTAHAFEDFGDAVQRFFSGQCGEPKRKKKKKAKKSFYVRNDRIKVASDYIQIEKIGKLVYKIDRTIPQLPQYVNPRMHFDGKYWILSFGYEQGENQVKLNNFSVGIDLGIKKLAVISNLPNVGNINKSKTVRHLKKKMKRLQRQCSRKYQMNKQGEKFVKTKNIFKLEKKIAHIHRRLTNIRGNHIHQATNKVIKAYPKRVVMEDLNITGMMKNKHLAEKIAEQKFSEFTRQMKYKCEFNGIAFVQVGRFFPSSKLCSCCGQKKAKLKLSERVYHCEYCGLNIDRDENAAKNLEQYAG